MRVAQQNGGKTAAASGSKQQGGGGARRRAGDPTHLEVKLAVVVQSASINADLLPYGPVYKVPVIVGQAAARGALHFLICVCWRVQTFLIHSLASFCWYRCVCCCDVLMRCSLIITGSARVFVAERRRGVGCARRRAAFDLRRAAQLSLHSLGKLVYKVLRSSITSMISAAWNGLVYSTRAAFLPVVSLLTERRCRRAVNTQKNATVVLDIIHPPP